MGNIQRWRRLAVYAQTALVAGLPFVYVNGESALRFDIPTMRLHMFGIRLWVGEFYVLLLAALLFFLLLIAFTLVLGRVWCGWACPQTAIGEYVGMLRGALRPRKSEPAALRFIKRVSFHILLLILCLFVSANLIWYFISPYEMLPALFSWSIGPVTKWFFLVMGIGFFAHFEFLGQRFCGTVCPYSKWQSVLLDRNSMVIAFDRGRAGECMGCDRCVTVCPTGIDIKDGLQVECINCAKCVDACRDIMARKGRPPLVRYVFGASGGGMRDTLTPKFWLFAAASALLAAMLVYYIAGREPLVLQVVKDRQALYRLAGDGFVVNSYKAYITNRGETGLSCTIGVRGIEGARVVGVPGPVPVGPGERKAVPFEVWAPAGAGRGAARIKLVVEGSMPGESAEGDAGFIFP